MTVMNNKNALATENNTKKRRIGLLQLLGIFAIAVLIAALLAAWWVKYNIYASEFKPQTLSDREEKILHAKLAMLDVSSERGRYARGRNGYDAEQPLSPEPYSEIGLKREIRLTEKELNSLVANNPEVARRVAIDLSDDLVSVKLIVPVDDDVVVLGGKTLRLSLGMVLSYDKGQPVVALKGISLGGIPLPNAWLGYLKNKNLVEEFGSEGGFWQLFSEGVKEIKVREGHILIRLKA